jgi:hypothetical protein
MQENGGKKCIFCGEPLRGKRTKEHVIPQWLLDHLGMRDHDLYLAVARTDDDTVTKSRRNVAANLVAGRVCSNCNNGWMSTLEDQARPILINLIEADQSLFSITAEERFIVSRWAAKTAYALSHATPLKKTPDPVHMRFLVDNPATLPPGVGVFAQQVTTRNTFANIQRNRWPVQIEVPLPNSASAGRYKIALEFRHLMLLVAFWPLPKGHYLLAAGIHVPLWPIREWYPAYFDKLQSFDTQDSRSWLDRFCSHLGIVYEREGQS